MPVDPNVFNNIKNFQDYNIANQTFLAQQQAANLAAQQQGSVLKGQTLYAAASTGDQTTYDNALQKLSQNGIDVSDVPSDVSTGAKYAEGLRQAQSPLGTLLNAASKLDSNTNAAAIAGGSVPANPNAIAASVLTGGAIANAANSANAAPVKQPLTTQEATTQPPSKFVGALQQANSVPANAPAGSLPQATGSLDSVLASTQGTPAGFSPPADDPNKTQAANQAAYTQALDAYKSSPAYIQQTAKATGLGKDQADATKGDIQAQSGYDQVVQTMGAIKDLINKGNLPTESGFIPSSVKASLNQNTGVLGNPDIANDFKSFNTLNEAQTIGAIRTLADTGQIRMTRTLENIINKGYLIDPNATDAEKLNQANIIQTELRNSAVSAHNINTGLNGGSTDQYTSPLSAPPSTVSGNTTIDPQSSAAAESYFNASRAIKAGGDKTAIATKLKAAGLDPSQVGL